MKLNRFTFVSIISIVLVLSVLACNLSTPKATSTPQPPTLAPSNTLAPTKPPASATPVPATATPEPTKTSAPTLTATPSAGKGPWWVLMSTDPNGVSKFWAVNADGSGLREIIHEPFTYYNLQAMIAPSGGLLAYIATKETGQYTGLQLKLLSLATGEVKTVTPLATSELETAGAEISSPASETLGAITGPGSAAWSPDGKSLAFMAAPEAHTVGSQMADLYIYTLADGKLRRISQNKVNGFNLVWSNDGTLIAYSTVVELGTGAGHAMDAVWLAEVASGKVSKLYDAPKNSGDEEFIGWTSPTTLLTDTWNFQCGSSNLRTFDVKTKKTTVLWKNCFGGAWGPTAFDPESGSFITTASVGDVTSLYLFKAGSAKPIKIAEGSYTYVSWWKGPNFFSAADGQVLRIATDGSILSTQTMPVEQGLVIFSLAGPDWALLGPFTGSDSEKGLWVGMIGSEGTRVFTTDVFTASWVPGTENLLFFDNKGVYLATVDNQWQDAKLQSDTSGIKDSMGRVGWVMP